MHKKELIQALRKYIQNYGKDGRGWKGQLPFAYYLIYYLEDLTIPSDEEYDFWRIEDYLPQILVDAWDTFRTSTDERAVLCRENYQKELNHEVPNITELGASPILDQGHAVQTILGFMMRAVTENEWIEGAIDEYVNAELHLLQQRFDKFLRKVYKNGMFKIINECRKRGMSGTFGDTELRTYVIAGRTMFTFARKQGDEEISFSFVSDDIDPNGLSAGIQSVYADLLNCLGMIDDVINNWPSVPVEQEQIFKTNEEVSLI